MSKLIAYEFLSLDGFMAGSEGQEMGFVTQHFLPEMEANIAQEYEKVDTFLFGRKTYKSLSQYWPNVTIEEEPLADYMNGMKKIIFTSTNVDLKWNNSKLSVTYLAKEVTALKEKEGKSIMVIGSASLVQKLTEMSLIDEYRILLFPVVLGAGKPLFKGEKNKMNLKLLHSKKYNNGVLLLTYSNS